MNKIRVGIVEDDFEWLKSLRLFLSNESDIDVVATASSKDEAIQMVQTHKIDIILMDINLDDHRHDGIYAAAEICQLNHIKVIMLSSMEDEEIIRNSFISGAVNYIQKTNYKEIPNAIRLVYNKTSPLEILLNDYSKLKQQDILKDLTQSEREVFELIEKGYTRSQIGQVLFKCENTIKNQIHTIYKKLGVLSKKEAIIKFKTKGLDTGDMK